MAGRPFLGYGETLARPAMARRKSGSEASLMNPVAVATMLGLTIGFFGLVAYALTVGEAWLLAILAILAIGLFVRWGE